MAFYKDGVISIPNVTGNVVITASAVQQAQPIEVIVSVGGFNHSVGQDFTSGETTSSSYSKTQVIDVRDFSRVTLQYSGSESGSSTIYLYYAGDDNIIDSSETWDSYRTTKTHTFVFPSGTTRIRIRGYEQMYLDRNDFSFVFE